MPDASAHVGKVFRYTIPSDAFSGDVIRYQVSFVIFHSLSLGLVKKETGEKGALSQDIVLLY